MLLRIVSRQSLVLCCAIACLFAASPARADLAQRLSSGVLRWGGDAEGGAPFQLRDPKNPERVIGFEVELADALAEVLARRIGRPLRAEFVQYEWVTLLPGLEKSDFDIILAGFEITPERRQRVLFSRPYYVYAEQLVVRKDDERIKSLADCRNKPVGTLAGAAADHLLEVDGCRDIVGFDGQIEPYLDLELGRLDAVLLDTPIVAYYAAPNPKLKSVGPPIGRGFYGIGVRTDDRELRDAIDAGLEELMTSGRLRDIYRRWHLWNADQALLAQGPGRPQELSGLGFEADGRPVDESKLPPVEQVDRNLIAASAQLWTFDQYAPLLVRAAGMTVLLTVASMAVAMSVGLIVCLGRLYGPPPLRSLALVYVEFFRGIPLLLVLFFLYFGLTHYGLQLPAVATAIVAFGLTYGAYESEVYRSAIESVPVGQWEAARALGMRDRLAFRRIIFPQALRTALGPMTNDFVALFKDTSLVSVIAVRELTKEYLILSRSSLKFVELGLLTAALYLAMSIPLGYLSRWLERRWGR
ncbi:MAG TPA: ABC transporter substrate-binding protein/permease [Pirellulales bacterium]|nr:ABC transporter substrate-binding protein/permease [Pirellulales bacterium]